MTHKQLIECQTLYTSLSPETKRTLRTIASCSLLERGVEEIGSSDVSMEVMNLIYRYDSNVEDIISEHTECYEL